MDPARPVSLKDIAQTTGVSVTAVSHVLNDRLGHVRVSDDTRRRVLRAADRLGYVPKLHARSMATRRSYSVGVLCAFADFALAPTAATYMMTALRGIEEICKPANHHTLFASCEMGDAATFVEPRLMKDGSVDGVIIVGHMSDPVARRIKGLGLPAIQLGSNIDPAIGIETVAPDLDAAVATVAEHLLADGLTDIHLFLPTGPGPDRIHAAFRDLPARLPGLRPTTASAHAKWANHEQGERYARELLARPEGLPQAVICSQIHAEGLVRVMEDAGKRFPADYRLVAITPDEAARPRLGAAGATTDAILLPTRVTARRAASRLLQLLNVDHPHEPHGPLVPCPVDFVTPSQHKPHP